MVEVKEGARASRSTSFRPLATRICTSYCLGGMRNVLIAVALVCCAAACGQPLRDLAVKRGVKIGAAVNPAHLADTEYAETLAREFNQAEPENAMKFGPIHPGA